jgi:hypothetical protein
LAKQDLIDAVSNLISEFDEYIIKVRNKTHVISSEEYFENVYIFYAKVCAAAKLLSIDAEKIPYTDSNLALGEISKKYRLFKGQFTSMKAMEEFSALLEGPSKNPCSVLGTGRIWLI